MANTYSYARNQGTDWSKPQWQKRQVAPWLKSSDTLVPYYIRRPSAGDYMREAVKAVENSGIRYPESDLLREYRHKHQREVSRRIDAQQAAEDEYWQKREDEENRLKKAAEDEEKKAKEAYLAQLDELIAEQEARESKTQKGRIELPWGAPGAAQHNGAVELAFLLKNAIGSGVESATMAHASELAGKIATNETIVDLAEAQKRDLALRDQFSLLEEIRNGSTDKQQVSDAERGMLEIGKQLEDPDHVRRVQAFKRMYVDKKRGEKFKDTFTKWLGSITNPFKNDPNLRYKAEQAERENTLNIYNAISKNIAEGRNYDDQLAVAHSQYDRLSKENQKKIDNVSLDKIVKEAEAENDEYKDQYVRALDLQDRAQQYWDTAQSFKMKEQRYQDANLLNPMYWLYVLPGTIGSSNSSVHQLRATAIQAGGVAAGLAATYFTGGGAAAAIGANIGTAASAYDQIQGGFDENYAEVGDKYIDNVRKALSMEALSGSTAYKDILEDLAKKSAKYWKGQKMSEKWIKEHCDISKDEGVNNVLRDALSGLPGIQSNDPRFKKAQVSGKLGLEALRWADNMRTMSETPISLGAQFMPIGSLLNKGKGLTMAGLDKMTNKILGRKFAVNVVEDAAGDVAARSSARTGARAASRQAAEDTSGKYKNGFKKKSASETFSSGYDIGSDMADAAGLGYAGHVVAGAAAGTVGVGARLAKQLLSKQSREFIDGFTELIMHKYQNVYDKLLPQDSFKRFALKYGLHWGKAAFVTSMAEGSEEGVQYLNSLEDYASKYGYDGISFGDLVINDIKQGGRVFNAYMSLLGIGNSELKDDAEFWNNVKGGFALGGGHSGIVRLAGDTQGAVREYNTNQLLINGAVFDREANAVSRASNRAVVEAVSRGDAQYVRNILNDMHDADRNRKDPNFTEDEYEARLRDVDEIEGAVNSKSLTGKLKAKGIEKGTKEFNTAIADIVNLRQQLRQNINEQKGVSEDLEKLYQKAFRSTIDDDMSGFIGYDDSEAHTKEEQDDFRARTTYELIDQYILDKVLPKTQLANRLRALLQLKAKINTANNWFDLLSNKLGIKTFRQDANSIKNSIDEQIELTRKSLNSLFTGKGFDDKTKTDGDLLKLLDDIDEYTINSNRNDILEVETTNALLAADRAVTTKYLDQFSYGVVETEDGKSYEYNPTEYKRQRKEKTLKDLAEATGSTYKEAPYTRSKSTSSENDIYVKRVNAINEADERNAKLNWMLGDIYAGDAAAELENEDDSETETTDTQSTEAPQTDNTNDTDNTTTAEPGSQAVAERLGANRIKYLRRVAKAKQLYQRTVDKFKKWKRGTTAAMVFPFDDVVVKALAGIIRAASIGVYKFDEFLSDVKDIVQSDEIQGFIPSLKYLYLKETAKTVFQNPKLANNFTSADEVNAYNTQVQPDQTHLQSRPYETVLNKLEEDDKHVIKDLSNWYTTFVNKDGKVTIYKQYRFDDFEIFPVRDNGFYKDIMETLNAASTKEEFEQALDDLQKKYESHKLLHLDFSLYKPYFGVEGINDAIAVSFVRSNPSYGIKNGQAVRDAIVNYIVTGDETHLSNLSFVDRDGNQMNPDMTQFVEHAKRLKESFDRVGLKAVKTNHIIYGTVNGENVASQADVVLVTDAGDIFVYDVVSTSAYSSIVDRLHTQPNIGSRTMYEMYASANKGTIEILQHKLPYKVKRCCILPVVVNRKECVFEKTTQIELSDVNAEFYSEDGAVEEIQKQVNEAVSKYNQLVDEYNALLDQHPDIDGYTRMSTDSNYTISDVVMGKESIAAYSQKMITLRDSIDDINNKILQQHSQSTESVAADEAYEAAVESSAKDQYDSDPGSHVAAIVQTLTDNCRLLDDMISGFTIPTTLAERDYADNLQNQLFNTIVSLNDVLTDPDCISAGVDVSEECQLIASVAEKIRKTCGNDAYNYPALIEFIRSYGNTPIIQSGVSPLAKAMMYAHRILLLTNTLQERLTGENLAEIAKDNTLKAWYATILNEWYAPFIDSVAAYSKSDEFLNVLDDDTLKASLELAINESRSIVDGFNQKCGPVSDSVFKGLLTGEVAEINGIEVKYTDSNGNWKTGVSPSYQSMHDGKNGVNWWLVSNQPDLLTNKNNKFEFSIDETGKLILTCDCEFYNKRTGQMDRRTIKLDFLSTQQQYKDKYNSDVAAFVDKVTRMLEYVKTHKDARIEISLSRAPAQFSMEKSTERTKNTIHNVSEFLMNENDKLNSHDLYTIDLSEKSRVGITKVVTDNLTNTNVVRVFVGVDLQLIYKIANQVLDKNLPAGSLVYTFDSGRTEGGSNRYRTVLLSSLQFTDIQATMLTNMLVAVAMDGTNANVKFNGNSYSYDQIRGILDLCMYMYNPNEHVGEKQTIGNHVFISTDDRCVHIGSDLYYIESDQAQNNLWNKVRLLGFKLSAGYLSTPLSSSQNPIIHRMFEKFRDDSNLQEITLPIGLTFKRDDFFHDNGESTSGRTLLGYYLSNGTVGTKITGYNTTHLVVDNVELVDSSLETQEQNVANDIKQAKEEQLKSKADDISSYFDDLGALAMHDKAVERTSDEVNQFIASCNEYVEKVFGKGVTFGFDFIDNTYSRAANQSESILGLCTAATLELSKNAPETAPFHEAFHRVLELLLSPRERESFYAAYRDRYNASDATEREVAEGLADMFTDYMQHKINIKKEKGLRKIIPFFKHVAFNIGLMYKLRGDYFRFKGFYHAINKGKFAGRQITKEQNDRFNRLFGEGLYYKVENYNTHEKADLSTFSNAAQIHQIADSLMWLILNKSGVNLAVASSDDIVIDGTTPKTFDEKIVGLLCGAGKPEDQLSLQERQYREILVSEKRRGYEKPKKNKDGTMQEPRGYEYDYYPNFAAISSVVASHVQGIISTHDATTRMMHDEQEASTDTDDKAMQANIDRFDRAAYEFSKLDAANVQTKLFFATIPYCTWNEDRYDYGVGVLQSDENNPNSDERSHWVIDSTRSPYHTPVYMPMNYVYNVASEEFGQANTIEEMLAIMSEKKNNSVLHLKLYQKFLHLYRSMYRNTKGGGKEIDYDVQNRLVNIVKFIKCQKIDATLCKSENKNGNKTTRTVNSAYDKDAATFPKQWSSFLLDGQTGVFERNRDANGKLIIKPQYGKANGRDIFNFCASFLGQLQATLLSPETTIEIAGQSYCKDDPRSMMALKARIITMLNLIGVQMSIESFDYMLSHKYGNAESEGLKSWVNDGDKKTSINTFISLLSQVYKSGVGVNEKFAEYGYSRSGFIKELGDWQGTYNRMRNELVTNGMDLSKLYTVSQNHAISAAIDSINRHMHPVKGCERDDLVYQAMVGFGYNITKINGIPIGSIMLKAATNKDVDVTFQLHTNLGFRTDNKNDFGVKYSEQPEVEDYISKLTLLQEGAILPGTLADKGTWVYITIDNKKAKHVKVPGLQFVRDGNGNVTITDGPSVLYVGPKDKREAVLVPNNQVLDQMIEYAECELSAIEKCIEDLKTLPDELKTANYYASRKDGVEPNGTRFWHLSALSIPVYDENGTIVGIERVNLNDPNQKSAKLVELAKLKFFNASTEQKRIIMALTMSDLNKLEVRKAVELGLIERTDINFESNGSTTMLSNHTDDDTLLNLSNVHLDETQIDALYYHLAQSSEVTKMENGPEKNARLKQLRSLAIAALLGDATNRSVISEQECERIFIGHPGFFKASYDKADGIIKDQCSDKQKRTGSLVSTGDDNVLLNGIPKTYRCAECKDYEVTSTADIARDVRNMFYNSELRHTYIKYLQDHNDGKSDREVEQLAFSASQAEIEKALSEVVVEKAEKNKTLLDKVNENTDKYSNSLLGIDGKINVADGASYITEDMCKHLLMMNGKFTKDVKRAFEILEDENSNWQSQKEATNIIYKKVALVTTKYTAYGFRQHAVTGVAVPYLNKFALFPLFKCNATGKLRKVYDQMKAQGVDNLLMTSAVKIGSQGAVEFNGDSFSSSFNIYEQPYSVLRKQLKTDPEEGERATMGTQMVKKALSNLILGRDNYKFAHSEGNLKTDEEPLMVTGTWLRDQFMHNIEKIRQFGEKSIRDKFYTDGNLDIEKLAKYLHQQLTDRNSDSTILRAMEVVEKDGEKQLALPMAATADSHWIESIIISTVNKSIIDVTTPGNSFVQRSIFGMEGKYSVEDGGIIGQTIYNGQKLQMVNEDGSMDAVISLDYFNNILPKGLSFNEARQWLLDNHIIGKDAKANTIGYRIPTQAQSSIHALRFVDVVLASQATVILPEEFTKITGSDFDIDHLYLASYNYRKTEDGKITTEFSEDVSEHYQNSLIDCMITLLKDVDNSFTELYKSIDNDTTLVKDIAKQIGGPKSMQHIPYIYGSLAEQISRRTDYVTGKFGIGPFALNTPSHVLTSLYNVMFKDSPFTKNTRIGRLDNIFDKDYNYIDAWLSAFINAHVDIVKDPYISKLNVNKTTYNHLNLLVRSGYGDASVWFMCHPVIRKISEIDNKYSSKFAKDLDYKHTKEDALMDALVPMMGSITDADKKLLTDKNYGKQRAEIVNSVLETGLEELKNIATGKTQTSAEFAKRVYLAWKILEPYALSLSNLVQYTKIDTRKQGNTFIDLRRYEKGYLNLVDPRKDNNGDYQTLFNHDTIQNLVKLSWIDAKTRSAISLPFEILKDQTFYANEAFMGAAFDYAQYFTDASVPSADLIKRITRAMETSINAKFFNQWMKQQGIDPHELFYGKWPITKQLNLLKSLIKESNKDYAHLKDNLLLEQLQVETKEDDYSYNNTTYTGIPFLRVSRNVDNSKVDSEALMQAWADLLSDSNKNVRTFAQKLVAYAFLTSGAYNGWNKLFKYVPFEWRAGQVTDSTIGGVMSYGDFISEQLKGDDFYSQEMLYDIISNNFLEYSLVKREQVEGPNGETRYFSVNNPKNPGSPNVIARIYDQTAAGDYVAPTFVAMRRRQKCPNQQLQYDLYMLVSTPVISKSNLDANLNDGRGAFYIKMPKHGYHVKHGYDIYEYGVDCGIGENSTETVSIEQLNNASEAIRKYLDDEFASTKSYDIERIGDNRFDSFLNAIYGRYVPEKNTQKRNVAPATSTQQTSTQNATQPAAESTPTNTQQKSAPQQSAAEIEKRRAIIKETAEMLGISEEEAKQMYEQGEENRKNCKGE